MRKTTIYDSSFIEKISHYGTCLTDYEVPKYKCSYKNDPIRMDVIKLLEKEGYSQERIGTYLFSELVLKVTDILSNSNDVDGEKLKLIEKLGNPYSEFYFELARLELDTGVTSFHALIKQTRDLDEKTPSTFIEDVMALALKCKEKFDSQNLVTEVQKTLTKLV